MLGGSTSDALSRDPGRYFGECTCKEKLDWLSLAALPAGLRCFGAHPLRSKASAGHGGCVVSADRTLPGDPYGTRRILADVQGSPSGLDNPWVLGPMNQIQSLTATDNQTRSRTGMPSTSRTG